MNRPPTDFKLLRAIYERQRDEYVSFVEDDAESRVAKIAVPIDIPAIASELGVDVDSVFGRLYFHLEPLYGENKDGSGKAFFMPVAGRDRNCVNFPLLEAVLAGLWQRRRRELWTLWIAFGSLGIAIGSLVVAIYAAAT